jgi:Fur family ferric uptake transcriptional regulator
MSTPPSIHGGRHTDAANAGTDRARVAELIDAAWAQFVAFLKAREARITQARRIVLASVLARADHFRADDLADDLATGPDRVSRGTVYRTLALLAAAGLVRQIRDSDVHVHYESCFGRDHHEHMICDVCGRFIEFTDPALEKRIAAVGQVHHFRPRTHRVAIFGTCAQCGGSK